MAKYYVVWREGTKDRVHSLVYIQLFPPQSSKFRIRQVLGLNVFRGVALDLELEAEGENNIASASWKNSVAKLQALFPAKSCVCFGMNFVFFVREQWYILCFDEVQPS